MFRQLSFCSRQIRIIITETFIYDIIAVCLLSTWNLVCWKQKRGPEIYIANGFQWLLSTHAHTKRWFAFFSSHRWREAADISNAHKDVTYFWPTGVAGPAVTQPHRLALYTNISTRIALHLRNGNASRNLIWNTCCVSCACTSILYGTVLYFNCFLVLFIFFLFHSVSFSFFLSFFVLSLIFLTLFLPLFYFFISSFQFPFSIISFLYFILLCYFVSALTCFLCFFVTLC
jgi:hypothetical protein